MAVIRHHAVPEDVEIHRVAQLPHRQVPDPHVDHAFGDTELSFRSQDDYISKYRRVLEHFDAVKVGLTATPALHSVQIFGDPIYTYSYREAVIDG
jgi:hypothetical protein